MILAVVNQKGGVGKTTTALNLGASLAELGRQVLLVDLDPQAHLTLGLGLDILQQRPNISHVLIRDDVPLASVVLPMGRPGLSLVPSSLLLNAAESRLAGAPRRELVLRDRLDPIVASGAYEFIVIDCMSSMGVLTQNALVAADGVLIPAQTTFFSLEGIRPLLATIEFVQQRLAPGLRVVGIVPTFHDARTRRGAAVLQALRERFGDLVTETVIARSVQLDEAAARGQSVLGVAPRSATARAFRQLAHELIARTRQPATETVSAGGSRHVS